MNYWPKVYSWLNNVQRVLYPECCVLCGKVCDTGVALCRGCTDDLACNSHACPRCASPLPPGSGGMCGRCQQRLPPFDRAVSPFIYQPPLDSLLRELKFERRLHHARLLGTAMARQIRDSGITLPELLLPVPLHRARLRERGYNQAIELSRPLSRILGIPIDRYSCIRRHNTRSQSDLGFKSRRANVRHAFELRRPLAAEHVAVVDDVMTTGATLSELARTLKGGGVKRVDVWSCARAVMQRR